MVSSKRMKKKEITRHNVEAKLIMVIIFLEYDLSYIDSFLIICNPFFEFGMFSMHPQISANIRWYLFYPQSSIDILLYPLISIDILWYLGISH